MFRFYSRRGIGRSKTIKTTKWFAVVSVATGLFIATTLGGCAGRLERQSHRGIATSGVVFRAAPTEIPEFDGTLNAYFAFALKHSPASRAAFQRWRAATLEISQARRLPEPTLRYGYFIRSIETRVGPQRHRIGISQSFPWPTKLRAASDAASEAARAARNDFEAKILSVRYQIADAYWDLWRISREHQFTKEHDTVMETLAATVRGRVKVGRASLADLNQIELNIARHHDHLGGHMLAVSKATARLYAVLGVPTQPRVLRATDQPIVRLPKPSEQGLRRLARSHPRIKKHRHLAAGQDHQARSEKAARFPQFQLGLDYIETGNARTQGVADSGKDSLMVSGVVSLPLWWGNYADAELAARARSASHRADREAAQRLAESEFDQAIADVRDSARRVTLHNSTLVPQAEATFQAVKGGYQTGRSSVASLVLAHKDVLELKLAQLKVQAMHAKAWARLEFVVGRSIASREEQKQ